MKKYTNFSKYFNTNPRLWLTILGIVAEIPIFLFMSCGIYGIIYEINHPTDKFVETIILCIFIIICALVIGIA